MSFGKLTEGTAASQMRIAALGFIIAAVADAILELVGFFYFILYINIISSVMLGIAIVFLGLSMKKIALKSPGLARNADTAGGWLITYVVLLILSSVMTNFAAVELYAGIVALIALVAKISGFMRVNRTFKQMSLSPQSRTKLDSPIFPLYGWYDLIMVIIIFASAFSWSLTVIMGVVIAAIVGQIILLVTMGIKLSTNATIIDKISVQPEVVQPIGVYTPAQAAKTDQVAFCSHCGANINREDKFCENCGAAI